MEAEQVVNDYRGWLYQTARQLLSDASPDLEDLVQEGRIALWEALSTYEPSRGALPAWLTSKARYAMLKAVQRHKWTGQPSRNLGRRWPAAEPDTLSLDAERAEGVTLADLLASPDTTEQAELSYHHREITDALANLSPRQLTYVKARFWDGMTDREMIEAGMFSYDPSTLWRSSKNGARDKLAKELAHLSDAI